VSDGKLHEPARLSDALVKRLHERAGADRWSVSRNRFADALARSVAKAFADMPRERQIEQYLQGLHLADLALACACADGHDGAWEHFVREHRPVLYRAAEAMQPGRGRELADSLYADLYGVPGEADAPRRTLLDYFHGRSSLSTWLRAVLAQRHVDTIRSEQRVEPLPDEEGPGALSQSPSLPDPDRPRWLAAVRTALSSAIGALEPRDRLRLGCYYAEDLTLAQIGRLLGEHEATVSRHLSRTRKTVRERVERLLAEQGLTPEAVAECLSSVTSDAGPLDVRALVGVDAVGKLLSRDRSV